MQNIVKTAKTGDHEAMVSHFFAKEIDMGH